MTPGHPRVFGPKRCDGGGGGGVAGHHDDIGPQAQQNLRDGAPALLDVLGRLFPVRAVRIVREIEIAFPGEHFYQFPVHGQAARA